MSELFGNRQKQSAVVLALILIAIFWRMGASGPDDPETVVTEAVKALVEAAEKEDLDPFRTWLSDQVQDSSGRGKEEIVKTLFGIFFRYRNIRLNQVSLTVDQGTNPDVLTARLVLLMGADTPLPTDKGSFRLTFRREEDTWRVFDIDWEDGAQYGL